MDRLERRGQPKRIESPEKARDLEVEENADIAPKEKSSKPKKLSNMHVSNFIVKNNIKRDTELFAAAKKRKDEGQEDLANFVLTKSSKVLSELIDKTWKMETAGITLDRETKSRMDILREKVANDCVPGCDKMWLECAMGTLRNNKLHPFVYAAAIRDLLTNGRGKFRNLMIIGPADCGKTFLFKPLPLIYNAFCNPANDKYAWVGADSAEVILLQDFRWRPDMIPWNDLLLLLEGEIVKLPALKNQFASDVTIEKDTPILATSKNRVTYAGKFNSTDSHEDEMMAVRWKII